MKYLFWFGTLYLLGISTISCFLVLQKNLKWTSSEDKPGNPLILTPLMNQGKVKEARAAAKVHFAEFQNVESYAAYLTVNEDFDSNLFFWFFPSETDYENAPVILWLQGGPGGSSLYGLFAENGPFQLTPDGKLQLRSYSWTKNHSVLYTDNPAGTGFSYTKDGYAQNQTVVAKDLYRALLQFFQVFSELQKNDFYVTGESYGGKYVPAISYAIHKNNLFGTQKINLQGLAVGNGLSDPEHQLGYADYLYQLGLIDFNLKAGMKKVEEDIVKLIHRKKWLDAENNWDYILNMFRAHSAFANFYDYLDPNGTFDELSNIITNYLQRPDVKAAIHVDNATFVAINYHVHTQLLNDIMQSVAPLISELLSHYRVLIYNGQLDIIVAYPLTVNYLQNLKFSAAQEYKSAVRNIWYVGSELAGYAKRAGNLTEVLVRNAGHTVPGDQPRWALDMISKFTRNLDL